MDRWTFISLRWYSVMVFMDLSWSWLVWYQYQQKPSILYLMMSLSTTMRNAKHYVVDIQLIQLLIKIMPDWIEEYQRLSTQIMAGNFSRGLNSEIVTFPTRLAVQSSPRDKSNGAKSKMAASIFCMKLPDLLIWTYSSMYVPMYIVYYNAAIVENYFVYDTYPLNRIC